MPLPSHRPPCKRYLEVFSRRYVEGRTTEQVAQIMGIKVKSVRTIDGKVRRWLELNGARLFVPDPGVVRAINAREVFLARLDYQWQQAMEGWHRSKETLNTHKIMLDGERKEKGSHVTHRTQNGDVRYLLQARLILETMLALCEGPNHDILEGSGHVRTATIQERILYLDGLQSLVHERQGEAAGGEFARREDEDPDLPGNLRAA